jgi:phosphohistidine phosphatase
MHRLILFRHGKTERHAPSGEDFDRRLTARGAEDSRLMGKVLANAGFNPDLVLVSSAVRAQQTWEAVKAAFPGAASEVRPTLYNSDARDLMRAAKAAAADTVMIVAHNPGLQELTEGLAAEGENAAMKAKLSEGFPTAAISVFDIKDGGATALGLFFPRDHGGGAAHD